MMLDMCFGCSGHSDKGANSRLSKVVARYLEGTDSDGRNIDGLWDNIAALTVYF